MFETKRSNLEARIGKESKYFSLKEFLRSLNIYLNIFKNICLMQSDGQLTTIMFFALTGKSNLNWNLSMASLTQFQ